MLLNVAPRTARGSRLSLGTRGTVNEFVLGGPTVINYDPEAADTQTVDLLDDPPFQDAGTGGPGNMALTLALDELSKEYEMIRDSYTADESDSTEIFNWYKGTPKRIHTGVGTCAIATAGGVTTATFAGGVPPMGHHEEEGHHRQGAGDPVRHR